MDSEWRDDGSESQEHNDLSTGATPSGKDGCHQCQSSDRPASRVLTSIRSAYTLASPHEPNANEVDRLMVKHFLDTLAEVALAVASRTVKQ